MAAAQQVAGLNSAIDLLNKLQGKSASSTQTTKGNSSTTTGSNISDEGMNRVIQQILAGPGGVKDISGAARGAGLYNSSSEAQLLNDLAARTAGETEKQRAGTTTNSTTDQTTTQVLEQPGISLGGGLGGMLAMSAAKPLLGGLSSFIDGKGFMEGTGFSNFMGGGAAPASAAALAPSTSGINLAQVSAAPNVSAGITGGATLGGLTDFGTLGSNLGGMIGGSSVDLGASLGSMADFAPSAGAGFALNAVPGIGSFLGGLLGGGSPEDINGMGIGTSALAGLAAGGPVGMVAAPVMMMLGSALGDISIICTALVSRDLLDKTEYQMGQEYLATVSPVTKKGYYFLCAGTAAKIAQGDKFWTAICLPFARQRTKLIAAKTGWKRWVRYPLGTLTKVIGQPICWVVGKILGLSISTHIKRYTF